MSICACYNVDLCLLKACAIAECSAVAEKRFVGVVGHEGLHELERVR